MGEREGGVGEGVRYVRSHDILSPGISGVATLWWLGINCEAVEGERCSCGDVGF